jgi:hypothetical protein
MTSRACTSVPVVPHTSTLRVYSHSTLRACIPFACSKRTPQAHPIRLFETNAPGTSGAAASDSMIGATRARPYPGPYSWATPGVEGWVGTRPRPGPGPCLAQTYGAGLAMVKRRRLLSDPALRACPIMQSFTSRAPQPAAQAPSPPRSPAPALSGSITARSRLYHPGICRARTPLRSRQFTREPPVYTPPIYTPPVLQLVSRLGAASAHVSSHQHLPSSRRRPTGFFNP